MLKLKGLTIKNFMSIGNVTQSVNFNSNDLVLVLGENLDLGGNDNRNGVGKAQPLYSKIKTPTGWITMRDISVGDVVSTPDGGSSIVTHLFPQGKKDIYRVTFVDGRYTDVCKEHLWKIYSHSHKYKSNNLWMNLTTEEIINNFEKYKNHKNKSTYYSYVPLIKNTDSDIDLPIDPYVFGVLLGDGSFSKNAGIGITSADSEIIDNIRQRLDNGLTISKNIYTTYGYSIKCGHRKHHPLRLKISELGLHGKLSHEKFIPEIYKISSLKQKEELIAGLVDTDGHIGGRGKSISISTSSEQMAKDIQEIIWSMGGIAKITSKIPTYTYKGEKKEGLRNYTISIRYSVPKNLSKLPRKQDKLSDNYQYSDLKLRIDKIERIGLEEAQCIMIAHPDHLYITDNYIVTHNSTIVNALSYALYGSALTRIKKDNLINKSNLKNMLVTLTFEIDGVDYTIERGRKPGVFKFIRDGVEKETGDDESQGEGRHTQEEIIRTIGVSHDLFKHILALNTYVEPFLSLGTNDQRAIIEELLGITKLSEKADRLKEEIRIIKDSIKEEEFRISAATESNKRIEQNISNLESKSIQWTKNQQDKILRLEKSIENLLALDIDQEIALHRARKESAELEAEYRAMVKESSIYDREIDSLKKNYDKIIKLLATTKEKICPTCSQTMNSDTHKHVVDEYHRQSDELSTQIEDRRAKKLQIAELIASVSALIVEHPATFYSTVEEAYNHKSSLENLAENLANEMTVENPYVDQIESLKKHGLQEIDFEKLNNLVRLRDHQEFLLKLLTNKDSFIRKKIIDQNLTFLNHRLEHYLIDIGLPHSVKFKSDLEVEISMFGKEFDFDNLSRGERTRLILSLSWAFRDVFESMNDKINLLFIDELVDNGIDSAGTEAVLRILKDMARSGGKNVFLISHRDEFVGRVNNVVKVVKEGGFTSIEPVSE